MSVILNSFFEEISDVDDHEKVSSAGLAAAGGALMAGAGAYSLYLSLKYKKKLDEMEKKITPLFSSPLGSPVYNHKADVRKAEKLIGKPIKVLDLSRVTPAEAKKYTGMSPTKLRKRLHGNAVAILMKPKDLWKDPKNLGKKLKDPAIAVHPAVTRGPVLHELGHIIDASKRTSDGKRVTRQVSNMFREYKKEGEKEHPMLLDEKAAWNEARKLQKNVSFGPIKSNALKTYEIGVEREKKQKTAKIVSLVGLLGALGGLALGAKR